MALNPAERGHTGLARPGFRRQVTGPIMFHGPGGSVGVRLGDDSLSYMVVTKTPDGKLAEDCVTGDPKGGGSPGFLRA